MALSREHQKLVRKLAPEMLRLLRSIEWYGDYQGMPACPVCGHRPVKDGGKGHTSRCAMDVLLTAAQKIPE